MGVEKRILEGVIERVTRWVYFEAETDESPTQSVCPLSGHNVPSHRNQDLV